MAVTDIILKSPYVLLTQNDGYTGLLPVTNNLIRYGTIAHIYDTSDFFSVGQVVMFDLSKGSSFMYGSTIYTMISDEFLTGQEIPPP